MSVEDILKSMDKSRVRVLSGDLTAGYWSLRGTALVQSQELWCCKTSSVAEEPAPVDLDGKITNLELMSVKDTNKMGGVAGVGLGAVAGYRFFGAMGLVGGAIAGHLLMGNRTEVRVTCTLADGRSFIAVMEPPVHERFTVIANRTQAV